MRIAGALIKNGSESSFSNEKTRAAANQIVKKIMLLVGGQDDEIRLGALQGLNDVFTNEKLLRIWDLKALDIPRLCALSKSNIFMSQACAQLQTAIVYSNQVHLGIDYIWNYFKSHTCRSTDEIIHFFQFLEYVASYGNIDLEIRLKLQPFAFDILVYTVHSDRIVRKKAIELIRSHRVAFKIENNHVNYLMTVISEALSTENAICLVFEGFNLLLFLVFTLENQKDILNDIECLLIFSIKYFCDDDADCIFTNELFQRALDLVKSQFKMTPEIVTEAILNTCSILLEIESALTDPHKLSNFLFHLIVFADAKVFIKNKRFHDHVLNILYNGAKRQTKLNINIYEFLLKYLSKELSGSVLGKGLDIFLIMNEMNDVAI